MGKEMSDNIDKPLYCKGIIDVLRDSSISKSAKALYAVLCTYRNTHTNTAWPTNETIGECLGSDRWQVKKWLDELVDKNVISITYDTHYKDKYKTRTIRFLHDYSDRE